MSETTAGGWPKGRLVAHPEPGKVWVQVPHRNDIGNDWIEADELPVPATPDRTKPTAATLLASLAATRAADEKAREQRLPWSAP